MIELKPTLMQGYTCPICGTELVATDFLITGMRNLVEANCNTCHEEFYCDIPAGQALYTPLILSKSTGKVTDPYNVSWFANPFEKSFRDQSEAIVPFKVEVFKDSSRCILVNCLDFLYGHSLLKLLNVQYYLDHCPDRGCIVMIPKQFRWLVPDGVAEIWSVDLPLSQGTGWYRSLEREIKKRIMAKEECFLSVAFSHPHPDDFDIERFTHVRPFDLNLWQERLDSPEVSFIWREDRLWGKHVRDQLKHVRKLAAMLRDQLKGLVFNVVGLGQYGVFPIWINDQRKTILGENDERDWCQIYARSHVVVGVHGSNMLLPSAHAGAVVELMPNDRLGNMLQDILFSREDVREEVFLHRFFPIEMKPDGIAQIITSLVQEFSSFRRGMNRTFTTHSHNPMSQKRIMLWSKARREQLCYLPDDEYRSKDEQS